MAVEVVSVADLTATEVNELHAFLTQLVSESNPSVDVKRGVIHDLVLHLSAVLGSAQKRNIDLLRQSYSVKALTDDALSADEDIIDNLLSNYRITRKDGTAAAGTITIVLSDQTATTIPKGAVFQANGVSFTADEAYATKATAGAVTGETDRLLVAIGGGRYAFQIDVTATTDGADGALRRGDRIVPSIPPTTFVQAYAETDFSGGTASETNEELAVRFQAGIAAKAWSNRITIDSMLRERDEFADILQTSIIGYGDAELRRNRYSIFPIAFGGRCDLFVRTAALPANVSLVKTATFIRDTTEGSIWRFSIGRDEAPGFYDVSKILVVGENPANSGFAITSEVRNLDATSTDERYVPDIGEAVEHAAFSPYQTTTIEFLDTLTSTTDLSAGTSTADYQVTARAMPLLRDIQEYVGDRDVIGPGGDVLVRGPVPCFVDLSFTIYLRSTTSTTPDTATIKTALADLVNNLGFSGVLHASQLADVIHNYLPVKAATGAIDMLGRVIRPDNTITWIRSSSILEIPDETSRGVSARTATFFLDPDAIGISVVTEAIE